MAVWKWVSLRDSVMCSVIAHVSTQLYKHICYDIGFYSRRVFSILSIGSMYLRPAWFSIHTDGKNWLLNYLTTYKKKKNVNRTEHLICHKSSYFWIFMYQLVHKRIDGSFLILFLFSYVLKIKYSSKKPIKSVELNYLTCIYQRTSPAAWVYLMFF